MSYTPGISIDSLDRDKGQPTPGQWFVKQYQYEKQRAWVHVKRDNYFGSTCIVEVRAETVISDELEANARLIAQSPELLALLKHARHYIETPGDFAIGEYSEILNAIDYCISQAEGDTP